MTCSVVICAHDEEAGVGNVVTVALDALPDVIVVADACTDETAAVASGLGARVIEISSGDKGSAMAAGLAAVGSDDVLFLDADLRGLLPGHVHALSVAPPAGGMVVGLRDRASPSGLPPISGERRLPAAFARTIHLAGMGYRAELAIDAAVARAGLPHRHYAMQGVSNPTRAGRHPLMWADLGVYALVHAPALVLYTEQGLASS